MATTTNTAAQKPANSPMTAAPQAFREMAEKGTTQAKETYEKMNAATAEATDLIKNSISTAVKGAQDYNTKVIEFAQANTKVALDFVQKLSGVKSPSDFIAIVDRPFARAVRDTNRADQGTCSAGSEGHACGRGAFQDRHHQGIQPVHLS